MFVIPKKILVGGLLYEISYEENMLRDRSSYGQSSGNKQSIVLDPKVSQQLQETTFIHEVLHQIDFVYNIGLKHEDIYALEAGLYAFLKNNIIRQKVEDSNIFATF